MFICWLLSNRCPCLLHGDSGTRRNLLCKVTADIRSVISSLSRFFQHKQTLWSSTEGREQIKFVLPTWLADMWYEQKLITSLVKGKYWWARIQEIREIKRSSSSGFVFHWDCGFPNGQGSHVGGRSYPHPLPPFFVLLNQGLADPRAFFFFKGTN